MEIYEHFINFMFKEVELPDNAQEAALSRVNLRQKLLTAPYLAPVAAQVLGQEADDSWGLARVYYRHYTPNFVEKAIRQDDRDEVIALLLDKNEISKELQDVILERFKGSKEIALAAATSSSLDRDFAYRLIKPLPGSNLEAAWWVALNSNTYSSQRDLIKDIYYRLVKNAKAESLLAGLFSTLKDKSTVVSLATHPLTDEGLGFKLLEAIAGSPHAAHLGFDTLLDLLKIHKVSTSQLPIQRQKIVDALQRNFFVDPAVLKKWLLTHPGFSLRDSLAWRIKHKIYFNPQKTPSAKDIRRMESLPSLSRQVFDLKLTSWQFTPATRVWYLRQSHVSIESLKKLFTPSFIDAIETRLNENSPELKRKIDEIRSEEKKASNNKVQKDFSGFLNPTKSSTYLAGADYAVASLKDASVSTWFTFWSLLESADTPHDVVKTTLALAQ